MDVDRMLNLEKRTGVKDTDISDFERKVNDVEAAIKGMLDGTVKPEDVRIEGIESEEEKAQKQKAREDRQRVQAEKDRVLNEQRKTEERERWWAGVEIFKPRNEPLTSVVTVSSANDDAEAKKEAIVNRYTADYSRWNEWTPTDEATLAETAEANRLVEEAKNKEFEKNNAEFCNQFLTDMNERKKFTEKKQGSADISRLKGNRYFKAKAWAKALDSYMEALRESPFDAKTVNNIAQVHIKTKDYDDALEFLHRTLYLESTNIKALSRKALVLGERGEVAEALEVMRAALLLEPVNADLLAQEKELRVIAAEKAAELIFVHNSQPVVQIATPAGATASESKEKNPRGVDLVDKLKCSLSNESFSVAHAVAVVPQLVKEIDNDATVRIYARTSGALEALIETVKSQIALHASIVSLAERVLASNNLQALLSLLAKLADGQRGSKILLVDGKVLTPVKALLAEVLLSDISLSEAALQLIFCACKDDISVKARSAVLSDKTFFHTIGALLGNVSFEASSSGAVLGEKERGVLLMSGEIVKLSAFVEQGQASLSTLDAPVAASLVCGVASALYTTNTSGFPATPQAMQQQKMSLLNLLVDVSLGMSQIESLRPFFALEVPMAENKLNKSKYSSSLTGSLLATMKEHERLSTNGMAALMNACLEATTAVRKAVLHGGGLALAMGDLALTDAERNKRDGVTLLRKAGLLARLAGDESALALLTKPDTYRLLCKRIIVPVVPPSNPVDAKWQAEERAHFVRVLANITKPSAACMAVGMQEGILPALLMVLPTPRLDCGEVTAASVTLMPFDLASPLMLGNAARCIMPYADEAAYAAELYTNKEWQGVEKLICAMASCPDMRVRKNIAILLAKGCRVAGVREKMTALRGMQMMIELQDKL